MQNFRFCKCGCGQLVARKGNKFIHGHNGKGKHYHIGLVVWNKGLTKETDPRLEKVSKAVSKTVIQLFQDPEYRKRFDEGRKNMKKVTPWNKGLTKETSEKVQQNAKNTSRGIREKYKNDPDYRERQKNSITDPEFIVERAAKLRGQKRTKEQKDYMSEQAWNRGLTKGTDKRIARAAEKTSGTMKEHFLDKVFCKSWGRDRQVKPNKLETAFDEFLQGLFPDEYRYVGDFQYFIGGRNPDFANINGQKKLIEVYGDYWHENDDPQDRIDHFKQYGFKTLIVWESDFLNDRSWVKESLMDFHSN